MNGHPRELPDLPSTWSAFGHELAGLRAAKRLTQREVAGASDGQISKSSLQRYEQGEPLPWEKAAVLDSIYACRGWVTAGVAHLAAASWKWRPGTAGTFFVHRWPAEVSGWVWIAVLPEPRAADQPHALLLRWGPWSRQVREPLPAAGLALCTGKDADGDGRAAPCHVTSNRRVSVLFGVHRPPPELRAIDIRDGWT